MDALADTIDIAVKGNDYAGVAGVFSYGPSSWQSVGQGEQRSLAALFIKTAVAAPGFFPKAFSSGQMMQVMKETLGHLPSTVEGAADNTLRLMIFEHKVNEEGDYSGASMILADMRMEDEPGSVYFKTPAEKCDGRSAEEQKTSCQFQCGVRLSFLFPSLCQNRRMSPSGV
jgi:hypothetical protein